MAREDRIRGCLLGGAVGDAMGAAIEFLSLADIRSRHGPAGPLAPQPAYGHPVPITDDTQMTLFTAEGLLRAQVRHDLKGICHVPSVIHHAYLRWLLTQGATPQTQVGRDGWLFGIQALHSRRAPGNTCLAALTDATGFGAPARNDSKGCGGVMRMAPVGLIAYNAQTAFDLGVAGAALTHGHPSGQLPAGHLAATLAGLVRDVPLTDALDAADMLLAPKLGADETIAALTSARKLAAAGAPSPEAVESLGGGWTGETALAIAVLCALTAEDFPNGVRRAAVHGGDSDSTAAICGNLLGALWGEAAIPADWLARLEQRATIAQVADDLATLAASGFDADAAWERYPGW